MDTEHESKTPVGRSGGRRRRSSSNRASGRYPGRRQWGLAGLALGGLVLLGTPPASSSQPPEARFAPTVGSEASTTGASVREWRFDATLDGRPIGEHTFRVTDRDGTIEVDSRASFDVRFLGIAVYSYEHHAIERWNNGCLVALDSRTDDNGRIETVRGALEGETFALRRGGAATMLPACTMTFAYWNPAMRGQQRLLNPQTGDYLDVTVAAEAADDSPPGAGLAEGKRYVIRGRDLEIVLWYRSSDDTWLALDSRTSRGGLVSYRLRERTEPALPR